MGWADQITKVFILKWSTTYKVIPKLYTALRASAEMVPNPISAFDSIGPREVWSQRNFVPPPPPSNFGHRNFGRRNFGAKSLAKSV